ncbi:hypothetical protein EI94DRAFT_1713959 [Lactarius quietus]|nr:hypothetical protein EI94DRAFT_1713959 [Lactarius quietus]
MRSEAYVLVTIPNATLTSPSSGTLSGRLALEYVTFSIPASVSAARDVLLVLRLGDDPDGVSGFEAPLDPARALTATVLPSGARQYIFHATRDDPEFTLVLPAQPEAAEDVELFHSVIAGYATDLRGTAAAASAVLLPASGTRYLQQRVPEGDDLRGRFVLVNEDNGEIVGALDASVRVREDPSLGDTGHENDPVVVELPEDDELRNVEVLVRTIPPEDRDWMVRSAVFASHVISGTTTLLTSAMTSASNYYIAHSTPSPHASGVASPTPGAAQGPSTSASSSTPPPPPSRTLLLLQSPTTRSHLASIYAVSGGAVKLSHKATAAAERLIQHVIGADKGKGRASMPTSAVPTPPPSSPSPSGKPPLPSRSRGPSPAPPPAAHDKPPLPLRRGVYGTSPAGSRGPSPTPPSAPPPLPLRTRTSAALSATLILAALSASAVRLVDAGGAAVAAAVSHQYGTVAGDNAALAASTMRNVVLVYVDVRGFGRKALVKRTAKTWAKGRTAAARSGVGDGRPR